LPGFLQGGAAGAAIDVVDRGGAFDRIDAARSTFAIEAEADGFEFFALHDGHFPFRVLLGSAKPEPLQKPQGFEDCALRYR